MISNLLKNVLDLASCFNITTVIIGGLALPAYNVARTTLDIDICIKVETNKQLNDFIKALRKKDIKTKQQPKINQDLFTIFGMNNVAEIWLKPCDVFQWDNQMVERVKLFFGDIYVLAVEDYLLTKLARSDRSSIDIDDILQILIANIDSLDWEYFKFRLKYHILDFKQSFL